MHKILLAATATIGVFALTSMNAAASPSSNLAGARKLSAEIQAVPVDWYWNHRRWHHRRYYRGRWRYWD